MAPCPNYSKKIKPDAGAVKAITHLLQTPEADSEEEITAASIARSLTKELPRLESRAFVVVYA